MGIRALNIYRVFEQKIREKKIDSKIGLSRKRIEGMKTENFSP
jgi:hypothetical protein